MTLDARTLSALAATGARRELSAGAASVTGYANALLARVDEVEPQVQA